MKDPPTISKTHTTKGNEVKFEDALELTGVGRFNYILCGLCTFINIVVITEMFGTSYVVASGGCDLELTTKTKGLVAAMPMLGFVLSAHLWGWLADTRGRRRMLLVSMWGSFIFGLISSFSINWAMLAVTKFLAAFFASSALAVTFTLLGECTPLSRRNQFVLLISTGTLFAQAFMTLIAVPVLSLSFDVVLLQNLHYKPWRLLQQLYGVCSLICAVLVMCFVKESPKFYASQGRIYESIKVLAEIYESNTGKNFSVYPIKSIDFEEGSPFTKDRNFIVSMWNQTMPLFRPPYILNTFAMIYIFIVILFVSPSFLMWLPTLGNVYAKALEMGNTDMSICKMFHEPSPSQEVRNVTLQICQEKMETLSFVGVFVLSMLFTVLNIINYYILKYVGKKILLIGVHVIGSVCAVSLPWIPKINIGIVVFFVFQVNLIANGLAAAFTVELYPTYLRAMAMCLFMMIARGISFVGITYIGILMEQYCEITFYGFGAFLLSGALFGMLLPSEKKIDLNEVKT